MSEHPYRRRELKFPLFPYLVALALLLSLLMVLSVSTYLGAEGPRRRMFTDIATPQMADREAWSEGGCWGDIDADGDQDLLVLRVRDPVRLWKNQGNGRFEDVASSILNVGSISSPGMCAIVDIDNDGDLDVYITEREVKRQEWQGKLLRNDGGMFTEVTGRSAARMHRNGANAVDWADMDGDGDLDAFVGGRYRPGRVHSNYLFEQTGQLRFRDVARVKSLDTPPGHWLLPTVRPESGRAEIPPRGAAGNVFLGTWFDYDGDGDQDLLLAIDFWGVELYRNDNGSFTQVTTRAFPLATDDTPGAPPNNAMGAAWGDYDNDGCIDVYITGINILGQGGFEARILTDLASRLYRNNCDGTFTDATIAAGFWPTGLVEWSTNFIDFDNDGDLDLSVVAGHAGDTMTTGRTDDLIAFIVKYPRRLIPAKIAAWLYRYEAMIPAVGQDGPEAAMPKLLYRNQLVETGKATFVEVAHDVGVDDIAPSRGSLWADLDNDGDLDWFVPARRMPNRLYRNNGPVGNFLRVRLIGAKHHQAIGAWVKIWTLQGQQVRHLHVLDGYLSQSQMDPHFGLGKAETVEQIWVRWPGTTTWRPACGGIPANRMVTLREDTGCRW